MVSDQENVAFTAADEPHRLADQMVRFDAGSHALRSEPPIVQLSATERGGAEEVRTGGGDRRLEQRRRAIHLAETLLDIEPRPDQVDHITAYFEIRTVALYESAQARLGQNLPAHEEVLEALQQYINGDRFPRVSREDFRKQRLPIRNIVKSIAKIYPPDDLRSEYRDFVVRLSSIDAGTFDDQQQ